METGEGWRETKREGPRGPDHPLPAGAAWYSSEDTCAPPVSLFRSPNLTKALGASEESPAQDKWAFFALGALHQPLSSRHVLKEDRRKE